MDVTTRFQLPLLSAGQAQKEVFHNEALQRIDACVGACVEGQASAAPPSAPVVGQCFLVAPAPSGAWAGQPNAIAAFGDGGWRFIAPREGLSVWVKSKSASATFKAGAWEYSVIRGDRVVIGGIPVLGSQQAAIRTPSGGTSVDTEARTALGQVLAALRAHGLIAQ